MFNRPPHWDKIDASGRGLQHNGLRKANERAVLTIIATNPGVSNAEISRLSGLAPQTVSAILSDVERAGLVTRGQVLRGRRGQPATPIFLDPQGRYALGCEIGWRHLRVVLINLNGDVLAERRIDYPFPSAAEVMRRIGDYARELVATLEPQARERVAGLGVAMPTFIWRYLHQVGADAAEAEAWRELDIVATLAAETGLDVTVHNDGNAGCWAEIIALPRPWPADAIYFLLTHFIAAGILGQSTLWEGRSGNAANLGWMLVDGHEGEPLLAHRVASIGALVERLQAAGRTRPPGPPETWDWDDLEPVVGQWLEASAAALARVIFNTTVVIETQVAVVDGAMPRPLVERLVGRIGEHLASMPSASPEPARVVAGRLGPLAPAVGAAELLLYKRYFSRALADIAG